MCKIATASVDIYSPQTTELLGSLTSVKRLFLCLPTSEDAYPVGNIFCSLVHLTVCICQTEWLNVLIRVLRDSPNLKTLIIQEATIKSSKSIDHDKKLEMLKDFPVSSRRSPACLIAFFWNLRSEF
ncbi:hypothetical protein ARALYDRAFT_918790 [Arabidopsis lyrata subsp. lyrata]|uniref:FBD domain-containing protein n=1 Tax=Arabidopsis lyrata subsp. lyrata TaxID=81972 RepID=D7MLR2_ARALL|nr:hypothetical protein ARALYDRAFT_918790 [Arabidopsis lyrata subsp. lyrata]